MSSVTHVPGSTHEPGPGGRLVGIVAPAVLLLIFVTVSMLVASGRGLWVDETTQIVGLQMRAGEQLSWLLGGASAAVRVPRDFVPPLSYWLGRGWLLAFGPDETVLRAAGVFAVALGLLLFYLTLRKRIGSTAALFALAVCCLSPNLVVMSTELRSYPYFLLFSFLVFAAMLRCLDRPRSVVPLVPLVLACVAVSYTHLLGVVVSFASLLTVLALQLIRREGRYTAPVIAIGVYTLSLAGIIPFTLAAASFSAAISPVTGLGVSVAAAARLAYRLFAHQSISAVPGLHIVAAACGAGLVGLAVRDLRRATPFVMPLGLGGTAAFLASLVAMGSVALSYRYNIWMVPFAAALMGIGAAGGVPRRLPRQAPMVLLAVLLGASAVGQGMLLARGDDYGHTRSADLRALVGDLGPQRTTVVFSDQSMGTYYPMHYWFGDLLDQYAPDGAAWQNTFTGDVVSEITPRECVVLVRTSTLSAVELRAAVWRRVYPPFPPYRHPPQLIGDRAAVGPETVLPAQEALSYTVYCSGREAR